MHKTKSGRMAKKGLWYNIHQKRKEAESQENQEVKEHLRLQLLKEVKKRVKANE